MESSLKFLVVEREKQMVCMRQRRAIAPVVGGNTKASQRNGATCPRAGELTVT